MVFKEKMSVFVEIIVVFSTLEFIIALRSETKLFESWSMVNKTVEVFPIRRIAYDKSLSVQNESKFREERGDIHFQLRVIAINNSFSFRIENGTYSGIVGDVLTALMQSMNFSIAKPFIVNSAGNWDEQSSKWTGAMSKLRKGKVDILANLMTMSTRLINNADFTIPLIMTRAHLIIKKPEFAVRVNWLVYFQTFERKVWVTIMTIMFLGSALLTLIKYNPRRNRLWSIISDNYLDVFGIFCQQGLLEISAQPSLRITYFSIVLTALIVLAAYSASVISILSVPPRALPFESFEDFSQQMEYKFIVLKDTAAYDWFSQANNNSMEGKMFKLMRPIELLPWNLDDTIQQVCNEKVAFYGTIVNFPTDTQLPCEIVHIGRHNIINYALMLQRKSPYTKLVNYHIMKFKSNGLIKRMIGKYYNFRRGSISSQTNAREVDLLAFAPLLFLLCGGVLLSVFILLLEFLWSGPRCRGSSKTSGLDLIYSSGWKNHIDPASMKFPLLDRCKNHFR